MINPLPHMNRIEVAVTIALALLTTLVLAAIGIEIATGLPARTWLHL